MVVATKFHASNAREGVDLLPLTDPFGRSSIHRRSSPLRPGVPTIENATPSGESVVGGYAKKEIMRVNFASDVGCRDQSELAFIAWNNKIKRIYQETPEIEGP